MQEKQQPQIQQFLHKVQAQDAAEGGASETLNAHIKNTLTPELVRGYIPIEGLYWKPS